ncbi:MAG: efflux RND transporter periplasmic adaptor subunit [Acetobacteraceae bacterium]|nr:efflux RND transporter periplasmic adaptor subunit [Acetobacteraceae bacterium]
MSKRGNLRATASHQNGAQPRPSVRTWWRRRKLGRYGGLALGAAAIAAVAIGRSTAQPSGPAQPGGEAQASQAVPVQAGRAVRRDVPIFIEGLGTVQAFQSVLVRAEVSGYLQSINFTEGQMVKPGEVLAEIDPRPYAAALAQAQAHRAADQATLVNDQVNLARDTNLVKNSDVSQQQVDNDAAAVRTMQANVQADEANIASAALNLSFCRITSPIEGVVGLRLADLGNFIQSGSTQIVTINQIHPISVVFTLPQGQLPAVRNALAAGKPQVIAYSQDNKTRLDTGTLLTPNNQIDTSTGTVSLKATFPNPKDTLWPGQFVTAHLQIGEDHNVVTVPNGAIQHGPDGLFVFVVEPDLTVAHQDITVSYQNDQVAVVSTGLNGGEEVVTGGQSRLQNGTGVQIREEQPAG